MKHKVIQTQNTKANKDKNNNKTTITLINTILTNNNEISKHKSHEIYNQYSPTNLTNSNNNNTNNTKKNTTLANTIKQIIHYSGVKKANEKDLKSNEAVKSKSKEYNVNNNTNLLVEENTDTNIIKKLKKNNLDNILSESDSCQEIDSMEEDSLSKGKRIKSSNMNLKNINNMKWDIIDNKNKLNSLNYKRHLTSGFSDNLNIINDKNSKSSFTKQKTVKEKKGKNMNIDDNNEEIDEDIIVHDNEFDNSSCLKNDKLNETKFPKLSINPFIGDSNNINNNLYQKSSSNSSTSNQNRIKGMKSENAINNNNNKEKEKINSTHHIKISTLGTIKPPSTNPNSSNLSNTIENLNLMNYVKRESTDKSIPVPVPNISINTNSSINSKINTNNTDALYRNLLLISKKGDREKFLEILEQIVSLPEELKNINYQDENGNTALHYSCDEGNLKIVEILLKANCETNIRNNEKKTPLHLASKRGYFDVSKKLIENGALINVYDSEKNTPLHYVCMNNYVELLKFLLTKLPQADAKNIYDKMPIDLTTDKEMKNLLKEYLKQNEHSFHKIKIYQTSDSKMKNLIEPQIDRESKGDFSQGLITFSSKNNPKPNLKKNNNTSLSPSNKSPRNQLRNRKKDFNSIQINSNIIKKNNINIESKNSNTSNIENNNMNITSSLNTSNYKMNQTNNNLNKSSVNSVIKKNELRHNNNYQKIRKDQGNTSKKNNKVLIQDSNTINVNSKNNEVANNNNYKSLNTILNNNSPNTLKKTKTVEQFSSVNSNANKLNNHLNSNKGNMALNDSRMNTSQYCNITINSSINNGVNRINISFNRKKETKKLNKSINRFNVDKKPNNGNEKNCSENKSKQLGNNLKYKNLLLDSIESTSNNNLINLNKTEENVNNLSKISKKSRTSLKKTKNLRSNANTSKNVNNNYNTIKISDGEDKKISKSKNKNKNKNKPQKKESIKTIEDFNNNLNNNCNISKISCGIPQSKNNNILDPINKSNIVDQTLADNIHNKLNLNSIEEERITPSSFICLAQLGKGSFGEVYLVQKINTKENFAMKVLRKERIMGQNLLKYAIAERNVLSLSNHPFIVKLNFAFQTSSKLFLILEYCPNGDLAKHLLFEKRFSEPRAKFYICEVLLALEDLHQRDIIFRDLKPDNVVLDEEGHCKLTDFGLSKEGVNENQYAKSFCGSIAYLAPEMLKKQGHGKAVDWYLLGVLFYEMLVGITPFFTNRKEDIFHNIEFGELKIPDFVSEEAASLLRGLLQKDPNKRLGGSIKDAQEIKEHPYFKDVDWNKVYNKEIVPPPVNIFINKIMHVYHKPRLFANDDYLNKTSERPNIQNMLPGWSFINNEES